MLLNKYAWTAGDWTHRHISTERAPQLSWRNARPSSLLAFPSCPNSHTLLPTLSPPHTPGSTSLQYASTSLRQASARITSFLQACHERVMVRRAPSTKTLASPDRTQSGQQVAPRLALHLPHCPHCASHFFSTPKVRHLHELVVEHLILAALVSDVLLVVLQGSAQESSHHQGGLRKKQPSGGGLRQLATIRKAEESNHLEGGLGKQLPAGSRGPRSPSGGLRREATRGKQPPKGD